MVCHSIQEPLTLAKRVATQYDYNCEPQATLYTYKRFEDRLVGIQFAAVQGCGLSVGETEAASLDWQ